MSDKLAGHTRKVLGSLGQGLEVGEFVGTSGFACENAQPIREHHHVTRAQRAVGEQRRNRIGNFSHGFRLDRLLDLGLLYSHGLRAWSGFAAWLLNRRIRLVLKGLGRRGRSSGLGEGPEEPKDALCLGRHSTDRKEKDQRDGQNTARFSQ
jgi:hypothetical protein